MGDPRRVTQELVEIEYELDPNRRVTQELAEVEYEFDPNRRVTQILVEVEYLAIPDEAQTQIRGHDQIQPWSITSDRLSQEVAGEGLRGGGPEGPLWVDAAIYPQPTVQGQALVSNGAPQWTASLTPTWLGQHAFDAGLVTSGNVGIKVASPSYTLELGGETAQYPRAISIQPTAHAVSERASISFDDWTIGQDASGDGVKTFFIYGNASERWRILPTGETGLGTGQKPVTDPLQLLHLYRAVESEPILLIESEAESGSNTDGGAVRFRQISITPSDQDLLGYVQFHGNDSAANDTQYARISGCAWDVTNTDEAGLLRFEVLVNATMRDLLVLRGYNGVVGQGEIVFNEAGVDIDFRIEGVGAVNALFVQGSDGYVAVGMATPANQLDVYHASDDTVAHFKSGDDQAGIAIEDDDTQGYIVVSNNLMQLGFVNSLSAANVTIDAAGQFGVGTMIVDRLLHAEISGTATNSVTPALRLTHESSNTVVAGFGTGVEFELEENDGNNRIAALLEVKWSDAGEGANADAYFDFLTMLDDGAAASRMVVGYLGTRVGIGTPTPSEMLHVYTAVSNDYAGVFAEGGDNAGGFFQAKADTTANAVFVTYGSSIGGASYGIVGANWTVIESRGAASNGLILGTSTADPLVLGTNNTEWIRILSTGDVGIHTPTPDTALQVIDDANTTGGIHVHHSNLTQGVGIGWDRIYKTGTNTNSNLIVDAKGTGDLLLQTIATGNVGIWNTAPTSMLTVGQNGGTSGVVEWNASNGDAATIAINTSDQILFAGAANGYLFDFDVQSHRTSAGAITNHFILRNKANNVGTGGALSFNMNNSTPANREYGVISVEVDDATAAAEDATMRFRVREGGSVTDYLVLNANLAYSYFPTGRVGMGTAVPFGPFHVTDSPGSGMFVTADDVAAGAVTIVPNAAGDVTVTLSALYAVSESGGGTDGGVVLVVNGAAVDLYDDGTDILTLAVAADGSVTLQRTAGATTFDVSLWMVWL